MGGKISTELISDNNGDVKVAVLIYTYRGGAETEQVLGAKGGNRHGGGSRERRMRATSSENTKFNGIRDM